MSFQAVAWALEKAPVEKPSLLTVLIVLCEHADEHGRAAYPSQATIAYKARKSDRQVRTDLRDLESMGLIYRGNQKRVAWIDADRRPVVYDMAMHLVREDSPPWETAHLDSPTSDNEVIHNRPEAHFRPEDSGRKYNVERPEVQRRTAGSVLPTNHPEPPLNHPPQTPPADISPERVAVEALQGAFAAEPAPDVETARGGNENQKPENHHDTAAELLREAFDGVDTGTNTETVKQKKRALVDALSTKLGAGVTKQAVRDRLGGLASAKSPLGMALYRIESLAPDTAASGDPRPDWCGECPEGTRIIYSEQKGRMARCPNCHPQSQRPQREPAWCGRCDKHQRMEVGDDDQSRPCRRCHPQHAQVAL